MGANRNDRVAMFGCLGFMLLIFIGGPLLLVWIARSSFQEVVEANKPLHAAREKIVEDLKHSTPKLQPDPKITGTYIAAYSEGDQFSINGAFAPEERRPPWP